MLESSGSIIMTRNLTPKRPYRFNLGSFSKHKDGQFFFTYYLSLILQEDAVNYGEYQFEITAYAENMEPEKQYVCIKFDDFKDIGENNLEGVKERVEKVKLDNTLPIFLMRQKSIKSLTKNQ